MTKRKIEKKNDDMAYLYIYIQLIKAVYVNICNSFWFFLIFITRFCIYLFYIFYILKMTAREIKKNYAPKKKLTIFFFVVKAKMKDIMVRFISLAF